MALRNKHYVYTSRYLGGFYLFLLAFSASFLVPRIFHLTTDELPNLDFEGIKTYPPFDEKFSIVIPTHLKRMTRARSYIQAIMGANLTHLDKIFIYWVDETPLPTVEELLNETTDFPIEILPSPNYSLADRFLIPENLTTRTILSSDDDFDIYPEKMDIMFEIYLENHYQNRLFGLFKRNFVNGRYQSGFYKGNQYNLVLTGFVFLDIEMLKLFQLPKYKQIHKIIKALFNGEDLFMNFMVSHFFKTSPVAIVHEEPKPVKGLSSRTGHFRFRSILCQLFTQFFGYPVPYYYFSKNRQPLEHVLININ